MNAIPELPTSEDTYRNRGFIQTYTGLHFEIDKPVFRLADITHSLSMLCRYNGHVSSFYSVAEHSCLVAVIMEMQRLGNPVEGLLHDATEAYLTDVPAPFKQFLPDWQAVDKKLDLALRNWAGLPPVKTAGCKKADWLALFIEAYYLTPDQGACYSDPAGLRAEALELRQYIPWRPMVPEAARWTLEVSLRFAGFESAQTEGSA